MVSPIPTGKSFGKNGVDSVSLPLATLYRLREVSAPSGYQLMDEDVYFYLSADYGKNEKNTYLSKFDVYNYDTTIFVDNKKGYMQILKIDEDTRKPLEGAVFGLFSDRALNDDSLVQTSIDYGNGQYYFGDIDFGKTLYLAEIAAPEGYVKSDTVYTVEISNLGNISISPSSEMQGDQIIITNRAASIPVRLTNAGGVGTASLYAFGLALIGCAVTILVACQKKKKEP